MNFKFNVPIYYGDLLSQYSRIISVGFGVGQLREAVGTEQLLPAIIANEELAPTLVPMSPIWGTRVNARCTPCARHVPLPQIR